MDKPSGKIFKTIVYEQNGLKELIVKWYVLRRSQIMKKDNERGRNHQAYINQSQ